ncbi:hypothetical protein BC828DRAFT_403350 [Blastocladiella britannica]|nr:hypothetical protein BC828DRAFT_403350 [Blastocladiella britannica]
MTTTATADPPSLLYELAATHEWRPSASTAAPAAHTELALPALPEPLAGALAASGAHPWKTSVAPTGDLIAVLADHVLELHVATAPASRRSANDNNDSKPPNARKSSRVASWPVPSLVSVASPATAHDLARAAWRRVAWSDDGRLVAVADTDGAVHVAAVVHSSAPSVALVHVATVFAYGRSPDGAKTSPDTAAAVPNADPIVYMSISRGTVLDDDAAAVHRILTVSLAGHVALSALTVTQITNTGGDSLPDEEASDPVVSMRGVGASASSATYRPLATFSVAPWLHVTTAAAYSPRSRTLYVTGKAGTPQALTEALAAGPDSLQALLANHDNEPVPVLPLLVGTARIELHPTIPSPIPVRQAPPPSSIWQTVASLVGLAIGGSRGNAGNSADCDPIQLGIERELTGMQLSIWPPEYIEGTSADDDHDGNDPDALDLHDRELLLLRDAGGNILVLDHELRPQDRYDGEFLRLVHQGNTLAHASWWHGALRPDTKQKQNQQRRQVPAIVTCCANGSVIVHSYPQFAPLSAAEQFAAPVALAAAVYGHAAILDCEMSGSALAPSAANGANAATLLRQTTPRGLLARTLRSLTNTLLWHFDDDGGAAGAAALLRSNAPTGPARHISLYQWHPLTPHEMLMQALVDRQFAAALDLAKSHHLDTDVIYQTQWHDLIAASAERPDTLANVDLVALLSKIKDPLWVLQACAEALPRDAKTARNVLVHGLRLTETIRPWAEAVFEAATASKENVDAPLPPPSDTALAILEFRLILLRLLDRLELYSRIHGFNPPSANTAPSSPQAASRPASPSAVADDSINIGADPNYRFLRSANLVDVACAYANLADARALGILFSSCPALSPFRPLIATSFPPYTDPRTFAHILPDFDNSTASAAAIHSAHWRKPDWAERAPIAAQVSWLDDIAAAADALQVSPIDNESTLTAWYTARARDIEARAGCADIALQLLDLARSRNVPGLGALHARLLQLNMLLYTVLPAISGPKSPLWESLGLAELETMSPFEALQLVMQAEYPDVDKVPAMPTASAAPTTALGLFARRGSRSKPSTLSGPVPIPFEAVLRTFIVPYTIQSGAYHELLDLLAAAFPKRPELVLAVLGCDDLWWHRVHPDAMVGVLDHDEALEIDFTEKVLGMAYSLTSVNGYWLHLLDQLYESLPDMSEESDDELSAVSDAKRRTDHSSSSRESESESESESEAEAEDRVRPLPSVALHSNVSRRRKSIPFLSIAPSSTAAAAAPLQSVLATRKQAVWRRVQAFEAHATAAEILAHVDLYVAPVVLRDASSSSQGLATPLSRVAHASETVPLWAHEQPSILRELVRRTSTSSSELDWLVEVAGDLFELQFWRISKEEVYGAILQHAAQAGSAKHVHGLTAKVGPLVTARVVSGLAQARVDSGHIDDAQRILSLIRLPGLENAERKVKALKILAESHLTGLTWSMPNESILERAAATASIPLPKIQAVAHLLGASPIHAQCLVARASGMAKAMDVCTDLAYAMADRALGESERAEACDTLLHVVRHFPMHARSPFLLQSCLEHASEVHLPRIVELWRSADSDNTPASPTTMGITPTSSMHRLTRGPEPVAKLVAPVYHTEKTADDRCEELAAWFAEDERVAPLPELLERPESAFAHARSLHVALATLPSCDFTKISHAHHEEVLYVATKQMVARSLQTAQASLSEIDSVLPTAIFTTQTTAAQEFAVLSATDYLPAAVERVALEMQELGQQELIHLLTAISDAADPHRFLSDVAYQYSVLRDLLRQDRVPCVVTEAMALADQVQLSPHKRIMAWLQANHQTDSVDLESALPTSWETWLESTARDHEQAWTVLVTIRDLLQNEQTTAPVHHVLYGAIGLLLPQTLAQTKMRQSLLATLSRSELAGWSVPLLAQHKLAGNREYFAALFHVAATSQARFESLRAELLPKLGALAAIDVVESNTVATSAGMDVSDLESLLVATWLKRCLASPQTLVRVLDVQQHQSQQPIVSPTTLTGSGDERSFGRLFASLSGAAISMMRPPSPSVQQQHPARHLPLATHPAAAAVAATQLDVLDHIQPLLPLVLEADWPLLVSQLAKLLRDRLSAATATKCRAIYESFPPSVRDPKFAFVQRGVLLLDRMQSEKIAAPFATAGPLLADPTGPAVAIQQLLWSGTSIATIESLALDLGQATALAHGAAAMYDASDLARDIQRALEAVAAAATATGGRDLALVLQSLAHHRDRARAFLVCTAAASAAVFSAAAAALAETDPEMACRVRAAEAAGLGVRMAATMTVDEIHTAWVPKFETSVDHTRRIESLSEWDRLMDRFGDADDRVRVMGPVWAREFAAAQTLTIEYFLDVRLQVAPLPLSIEQSVVPLLTSQVHLLAFTLTSTHADLVAYGKALLPPPATDPETGAPVQFPWPAPLAALVPVLQTRPELADMAAQFGLPPLAPPSPAVVVAAPKEREAPVELVTITSSSSDPRSTAAAAFNRNAELVAAASIAKLPVQLWAAVLASRLSVALSSSSSSSSAVPNADDTDHSDWGAWDEPPAPAVAANNVALPVAAVQPSSTPGLVLGATDAQRLAWIKDRFPISAD